MYSRQPSITMLSPNVFMGLPDELVAMCLAYAVTVQPPYTLITTSDYTRSKNSRTTDSRAFDHPGELAAPAERARLLHPLTGHSDSERRLQRLQRTSSSNTNRFHAFVQTDIFKQDSQVKHWLDDDPTLRANNRHLVIHIGMDLSWRYFKPHDTTVGSDKAIIRELPKLYPNLVSLRVAIDGDAGFAGCYTLFQSSEESGQARLATQPLFEQFLTDTVHAVRDLTGSKLRQKSIELIQWGETVIPAMLPWMRVPQQPACLNLRAQKPVWEMMDLPHVVVE